MCLPATVAVYRKSFETFWCSALERDLTDPAEFDHRVINDWCDHFITAVAARNGRPGLATDPDAGEQVPKSTQASTRADPLASAGVFGVNPGLRRPRGPDARVLPA